VSGTAFDKRALSLKATATQAGHFSWPVFIARRAKSYNRGIVSKSSTEYSCREGCGACCIAPSITSAIPGMPNGKPAGVPCVQLDANYRCRIFGLPERPAVCAGLQPAAEMCGPDRTHALVYLQRLDRLTSPFSLP
jgi:hypothetical protein